MSYARETPFCSSAQVPNGVPERAAMQAVTAASAREALLPAATSAACGKNSGVDLVGARWTDQNCGNVLK
jgi:hypothetical protein